MLIYFINNLIESKLTEIASFLFFSHNGAPTKAAKGIIYSFFFNSFLIKLLLLTSPTINLKFLKKIVPNSRLHIETKIRSFKRGLAVCEGVGLVEKKTVCKAEFNLILPEEIKKYNLKK